MKKYLGVDYGKKKVGLAISDSLGKVAMPYLILDNDKNFLENFKKIILEEKINEVVLGKSLNLDGKENIIQKDIEDFNIFLKKIGVQTHYVNEIFSSMESKWGVEKKIRRDQKKNKKKNIEKEIDHKAASIILNSFLEKNL